MRLIVGRIGLTLTLVAVLVLLSAQTADAKVLPVLSIGVVTPKPTAGSPTQVLARFGENFDLPDVGEPRGLHRICRPGRREWLAARPKLSRDAGTASSNWQGRVSRGRCTRSIGRPRRVRLVKRVCARSSAPRCRHEVPLCGPGAIPNGERCTNGAGSHPILFRATVVDWSGRRLGVGRLAPHDRCMCRALRCPRSFPKARSGRARIARARAHASPHRSADLVAEVCGPKTPKFAGACNHGHERRRAQFVHSHKSATAGIVRCPATASLGWASSDREVHSRACAPHSFRYSLQ